MLAVPPCFIRLSGYLIACGINRQAPPFNGKGSGAVCWHTPLNGQLPGELPVRLPGRLPPDPAL